MKFNEIAEFERTILNHINKKLKDKTLYLNGLSLKAIFEWFDRNPRQKKLKSYLMKLTVRIKNQRQANSYDLYKNEKLPNLKEILGEINNLID